MTQAQPLIQTLPMTLGAPMSDDPSNPTAIEIPLQIELPNGQTLFAAVALGGLPFDGQRQIAERITAAWNAFTGVTTEEIKAPVKCLHQIAEPAAQGLDIPVSPHLGDHWKAALLDGRTLERDENGMGWHPALPSFDEATDTRKFYEAFGMEICQVSAESELEWEEYERLAGLEPNGEFNFSEWTPKAPEGEGWKLVSIHDTEDGPYAWWLRDAALAAQAKQAGA